MEKYDNLLDNQDTITNLTQAVDTLMKMQDEDRMSLYITLAVVIAQFNGLNTSPNEILKQKDSINGILERYEIDTIQDLVDKTKECGENIRNRKLLERESLGGVQ